MPSIAEARVALLSPHARHSPTSLVRLGPTVPAMTESSPATVHTFRIDVQPRDDANDPHLLAEAGHLGLSPTSILAHRYYLVRTTAEEVAVRKMAEQLLATPCLRTHLVPLRARGPC